MGISLQSFLKIKLPNIRPDSATVVIELNKEGATVPFIARYRKEKTGNLNEVDIHNILECSVEFEEIEKRKLFLIKEIQGQGNLTADLQSRIEGSLSLDELNELYRPYKKKKKTKATLAREAGIEPLAQWIWDLGHGQIQDKTTLEVKAKDFLNPGAQFVTYETVLKGAMDILVEKISNAPDLRELVRTELFEKGQIVSSKTKEFKEHSKYQMYADHKEPIKGLLDAKANHRYLAMRRAWHEGEITVTLSGDEEKLLHAFNSFAATVQNQAADFLHKCAKTALTIHVHPSIATEIHGILKTKADGDAITVFAENVRKVLLASPFGTKCVLGVDPGIRTGCKIALVDKIGRFISHTVLHTVGEDSETKAKTLVSEVCKQIKIDAIAVGNGTAGRETQAFLRKVVKEIGQEIPVLLVNESGASIYSASEVGRQEFPDLDLTVRGAISIARRLQDPLAELVKVDPKSIGVGQYQHDVAQPLLKKSLHNVVESCVNQVGVELNTASESLLSYASGVGEGLAKRIIEFRQQHGPFKEREELLKVPHFTAKAYEQSAGFFRISDGHQILDRTGVHPERYSAVREMAHELGITPSHLLGEGAKQLETLRTKWSKLIGEYTFDDIVKELATPGRDPRDPFKAFSFRDDIFELKDLKEGMICPGIVTNVTNFGAFVDIGVHQDGLVHISALAQKFVDDPKKIVSPGDQVTVKVLAVDRDKNQISLSMNWEATARPMPHQQRARSNDGAGPAAQEKPRPPKNRQRPEPSNREGMAAKDQKWSGPKDSHKSKRRKGGHSAKEGEKPQKEFRKSTPFNNPFAALGNLRGDSKK